MDYKTNTKKTEVMKSLSELQVIFNTSIDCKMNPKLCNFSTLLSQTINKTILYLENNNVSTITKLDVPDININYEQLSKLNNKNINNN